jgi:hypothetical protein
LSEVWHSHSLGINAIVTFQRISVWVERAEKNKDICNDVLLKRFYVMFTYGEDVLQSDATYATVPL